jgi:hypothetical protein
MFSPNFLEDLRSRIPVSAVVGRRVRLVKAGREMKGLSPFNKERTPSFFVNDQKQFWHDFSSGKHGDVFRFVMETEGRTFPQAVEEIAALAGVSLPETYCSAVTTPSAPVQVDTARAKALEREHEQEVIERRRKALQLWRRSLPAEETIVANYLQARGYCGRIPATVRYLPRNGSYPSALIAAYGMTHEVEARDHNRRWEAELAKPLPMPSPNDPRAVPWEPGPWLPDSSPDSTLHVADADVVGVHLIKLKPDGSDRLREDEAKITIGLDITMPVVLAAPNDGLGLAIAEGIEDALIAHQETGLGAWAACSAGRLPKLADHIPRYIESITVLVDDNTAGRTHSRELAARAHARGLEVLMVG